MLSKILGIIPILFLAIGVTVNAMAIYQLTKRINKLKEQQQLIGEYLDAVGQSSQSYIEK